MPKLEDGRVPDLLIETPGWEVASWSPTFDGSVPPTQVHLFVTVPDIATLYTRFKSRRALDEFIAALIEHRDFVWGKGK